MKMWAQPWWLLNKWKGAHMILAVLLALCARPVLSFSAASPPKMGMWEGQAYRFHAMSLRVTSLRGGCRPAKNDSLGKVAPCMVGQNQQAAATKQAGLRFPISGQVLFVTTAMCCYILIIANAKVGIAKLVEKGLFEPFLKNVSLLYRAISYMCDTTKICNFLSMYIIRQTPCAVGHAKESASANHAGQ
jgi:hypothetical protein